MVKFLAINARPTTARAISRSLPEAMSRAFIGRIMNANAGQTLRHSWLGIEADPLVHSDSLLKAYNRPASEVSSTPSSSKWFISMNAIIYGLGLLGLKQGGADSTNGEAPPAKSRRKRIVRKKLTTSV